jgi:hypothetical protein
MGRWICCSVIVCTVGIALPFTFVGRSLGFVPLPPLYWPVGAGNHRLLCYPYPRGEGVVRSAVGNVNAITRLI